MCSQNNYYCLTCIIAYCLLCSKQYDSIPLWMQLLFCYCYLHFYTPSFIILSHSLYQVWHFDTTESAFPQTLPHTQSCTAPHSPVQHGLSLWLAVIDAEATLPQVKLKTPALNQSVGRLQNLRGQGIRFSFLPLPTALHRSFCPGATWWPWWGFRLLADPIQVLNRELAPLSPTTPKHGHIPGFGLCSSLVWALSWAFRRTPTGKT